MRFRLTETEKLTLVKILKEMNEAHHDLGLQRLRDVVQNVEEDLLEAGIATLQMEIKNLELIAYFVSQPSTSIWLDETDRTHVLEQLEMYIDINDDPAVMEAYTSYLIGQELRKIMNI